MTRRGSPCEEAATRLLGADADTPLPAEVTAHLAECGECGLLARDLGVFRALVADARADVDARVPAPDVLTALASGPRTNLHDAQRPLRLVQGGASAPVPSTARRAGTPRRVIPIAIAVAACVVAATAGWVLLHPSPPDPREVPSVVLRDTGERPDAPRRAVQPALPAISVTAPVVAPAAPVVDPEGSKEPTSHPRRVGSNPRTPSSAASETPSPDLEAQRTLRRQMPRLQNCYERALRRDLRLGDATADLTVDIAPNGAIESVAVSGNATPELRRCLEQTVRNAAFPGSDTGLRVTVPLRFEVVRERMGTNIAPGSRTQD